MKLNKKQKRTATIASMAALLAVVLLFLFQYIPPKNMVSKRNGVMYLICYIFYMIKMFVG